MLNASSAALFLIGVVVVAILLTLYVFGSPSRAIRYFRTDDGRNVLKGIVAFILFGVFVVGLVTAPLMANADEEKGEWFAYGEVYLGVDHPMRHSPQCEIVGPNDRLTSHGGLRANIYQSADDRFEFNTKYTHHSCAFSPDDQTYDAVGIELSYRIW